MSHILTGLKSNLSSQDTSERVAGNAAVGGGVHVGPVCGRRERQEQQATVVQLVAQTGHVGHRPRLLQRRARRRPVEAHGSAPRDAGRRAALRRAVKARARAVGELNLGRWLHNDDRPLALHHRTIYNWNTTKTYLV